MTITENPVTETETEDEAPGPVNPVAQRQAPWSALGQDVTGLDLDEALEAAGADFEVELAQVTCVTSDGVSPAANYRGVMRTDTHEVLSIQGAGYVPFQYKGIAEIAFEAVGFKPQDYVLERMGTMDGGRRFFAAIDLGTLVIDPKGIADEVASWLMLFGSHDGSLAITIAESNFRLMCLNQAPTLRAKGKRRQGGFYTKHTKNMPERVTLAAQGLTVADAAAKLFVEQAEAMLKVKAGEHRVHEVIRALWGKPKDSDRARTIAEAREKAIVGIYNGPTCAQAVGHNNWAVFNAITEYADHGRGTTAAKRAAATLEPNGWVEKLKLDAGKLLLPA